MSSSDNLLADLTCSLCLNLFEVPKSMPSCPHTFCLECLEQVVKADCFSNVVRCPECRAINYLPTSNGIKGFTTNIVVQKIVERMKLQRQLSEEDDSADVCSHVLLTERRQTCQHCQKDFCNYCKYRHMESIKTKISEISQDLTAIKNGDVFIETIKSVSDTLNDDRSAIDLQLDSLSAMIRRAASTFLENIDSLRKMSKQVAETELARLEQISASLMDGSSLEARRRNLESVSIFKQDLGSIAQLYLDYSKQKETVESLQRSDCSVTSPLLALHVESSIAGTLAWLENGDLGVLLLNNCRPFADFTPASPTQPRTCDSTSPIPGSKQLSNKRQRPSLWKQALDWFGGNSSSNITDASVSQHHLASRNTEEVSSVRNKVTKAIIAIPGQLMFAVFHGNNNLTFFDCRKQVKGALTISAPSDVFTMTIEAIACDDEGSSIFFTCQTASAEDGELARRIYRIIENGDDSRRMSVSRDAVPHLFAVGDFDDSFKGGVVISSAFKLVITTDNGDVVAYSYYASSGHDGQLGIPTRRWKFGPSILLHGIQDGYSDSRNGLTVICSVSNQLASFIVELSDDADCDRVKPKLWRRQSSNDEVFLKTRTLKDVCFWRRKALVISGSHILKVETADTDPVVTEKFRRSSFVPTANGSDELNNDRFGGMAVVKGADFKIYLAVITNLPSNRQLDISHDVDIICNFKPNAL